MVEASPWPILAALRGALVARGGLVSWLSGHVLGLFAGLIGLVLSSYQWWRDVSREATGQGHHPVKVALSIRWGIALFITSEVLFFFSFFWSFFHSRLRPRIELGLIWPPTGVLGFNPFSVPLLNTTILLSSGLTVTWAHHAILMGALSEAIIGLAATISLGAYFTIIQYFEYSEAYFTFADSVYGSCFYIATGFHGMHVLVGRIFLAVCIGRLIRGHFSSRHHFGFEAAAWYWHFVDVVWLFLFVTIYWWGLLKSTT